MEYFNKKNIYYFFRQDVTFKKKGTEFARIDQTNIGKSFPKIPWPCVLNDDSLINAKHAYCRLSFFTKFLLLSTSIFICKHKCRLLQSIPGTDVLKSVMARTTNALYFETWLKRRIFISVCTFGGWGFLNLSLLVLQAFTCEGRDEYLETGPCRVELTKPRICTRKAWHFHLTTKDLCRTKKQKQQKNFQSACLEGSASIIIVKLLIFISYIGQTIFKSYRTKC